MSNYQSKIKFNILSSLLGIFGIIIVNLLLNYFSNNLDSGLDLDNYAGNFNNFNDSNTSKTLFIFYAFYFFLTTFTLDPILSLQIISSISIFIIIKSISSQIHPNKFYLFILLLHPRFLDLIISQNRSALALSIFFLSFYILKNKFLKFAVYITSSFIHISMLLFILIYYIKNKFNKFSFSLSSKYSSNYKKIQINRIFFYALSSTGVIILYKFAAFLNIRGTSVKSSTSFTYSLMWIMTSLVTFYILSKKYKPLLIEDYILILLTLSAPILTIVGAEVLRMYAYAIPFAVVSISKLGKTNGKILLLTYLLNQSASTYFWLKLHFIS